MNNPKTIIFDIDGTLIDESQSLMAQTSAVADTFGSSLAERQAVVNAFFAANDRAVAEGGQHKNDIKQYIEWMGETLNVPVSKERAEELAASWKTAFTATFSAPEVFADTIPSLTKLREQGYQLLAASGGAQAKKLGLLKEAGLAEFFPTVYAATDVGWQKQDVRFWQHLLKAESLDPESTLVVGNQINDDIMHPLALGLQTALIERDGVLNKNFGPADMEPHYHFQSLSELVAKLT